MAGCGPQKNAAYTVHIQPQWQGEPYHIAFDTQAGKPNPAGITIPAIKYTANPDALETRACLVVRFDSSAVANRGQANSGPIMDQMVVGPFDIHGAEGALPANIMDMSDQGLAKLLGAYGVKGKTKVSVLLARSSISRQPGDDEIDTERLSDWLPIELAFKSPHSAR